MMKIECGVCPHLCMLSENQTGICRARKNINGTIKSISYGKITSMALDPIEKKPLRRFMTGSMILSIGSFGCNMNCPFCQNHSIAMRNENEARYIKLTPKEIVDKAISLKNEGNIGIAYTYNEPLISYEFVKDCSILASEMGLKNVVVTNGNINGEPLRQVLPHIDAMNIDLKAFNYDFYKKIGGDFDTVKESIVLSARHCHVEVTCLIIEGENDKPEDMEALSKWLSGIGEEIPLHITQFHPAYKYMNREKTKRETIERLAQIGEKYLKFVYY